MGTVGSGRRKPALEEFFGRAVRDRRREVGMTQARLAELAGMSQAAISRLERGRCLPTLHLLERVAVALDSVLLVAIEPSRRVVVRFRACVPGAMEAVGRTWPSRAGDAVAVVD